MARIRSLKPEFFRSRSLARCSRDARTTFQGLWCEADDYGRGVADARILKGSLWPLDDDIDHTDVEKHLGELEETDHIRIYEIGADRYYEVVSWVEHQSSAYRRGKGVYPDADGNVPHDGDDILHDGSCKEMHDARPSVLEGKGREGSRERGRASRGSRIPDTFTVTDEMAAWARTKCPDIDQELHTQRFVNYFKAATGKNAVKLDWDRTWMNWLLKEEASVPAYVKKQRQVAR